MSERHLKSSEIATLLVEPAAHQVHLSNCAECATVVHQLRSTISGFSQFVQSTTDRTEADWTRQRSRIMSRISQPRNARSSWAWLPAYAALVVVGVVLVLGSPAAHYAGSQTDNSAVQRASSTTTEKDFDALLLRVAEDLERDAPEALAPAGLLVRERNRILNAGASSLDPNNN